MEYAETKLGLTNYLEYKSYKHQRKLHPEIDAENWVTIFDNQLKFEEMYLKEKQNER